MANSELDANQVIQAIYDQTNNAIQVEGVAGSIPLGVEVLNSLVPVSYDSLDLTYWASGNGAGQVETVAYYVGGLSGTLVATLTLNYNSAGQVSNVVRT